jgi:hypothetical protein
MNLYYGKDQPNTLKVMLLDENPDTGAREIIVYDTEGLARFRFRIRLCDLRFMENGREAFLRSFSTNFKEWLDNLPDRELAALYERETFRLVCDRIRREALSVRMPCVSPPPTELSDSSSDAFDPLKAAREGNVRDKERARQQIDQHLKGFGL